MANPTGLPTGTDTGTHAPLLSARVVRIRYRVHAISEKELDASSTLLPPPHIIINWYHN